MPNYRYTARTRSGESTTGTAFAESDLHLRELLRGGELFLTQFQTVDQHQTRATERKLIRPRRVKLGDMVEFSRQLATLVRAGITIVEALHAVELQTENELLREALAEVRIEVLAGSSLAAAFRQHPKIFNDLFISLVEAGEAGGVLDQTLEVAADQFDKESVIKEQVKAAMTYPKLVIAAVVVVVAFMLVFIVPTFGRVYKSFDKDLPLITQSLMSLSNVVLRWWWVILLLVIALVVLFKRYRETPDGRMNVDRLVLRLPVFGKVMRKLAIARFTQTWSGATRGGIPILRALAVSAKTSGNAVIESAIINVAGQVQEGSPLGPPLDETGEFPPLVTRMIASGEKSGNLELMLQEITKFYQRDVDYAVNKMTKILEPALTVIVGGIVLFVLIALYMPAFMLTQTIKR
jgi:type IV pilus assembly protein PilC